MMVMMNVFGILVIWIMTACNSIEPARWIPRKVFLCPWNHNS